MRGRRVFVSDGQDPEDALRSSLGKEGRGQSPEANTTTLARLKSMIKDGRWEPVSDITRQGFQELRNVETKDRFTVRVRDAGIKYNEEQNAREYSHFNAVRGIEIFASGLHNGDTYTEQDIDDIIAAHKELDFRPAIKIGHSKDAPGAPAYGWVTALRKVGGKLVADFESMHDSVITALKDKRYDRVSSEIYFNLKRGGKSFRRALKAVALLGADVPAVAGLVPLHKMEFVADGFESVAKCEQGLEIQKQAIIDSLTERVAQLSGQVNTQKEQDAMTIKELNEKKVALEAQLAALKAKGGDADKVKITEFEAQIKTFGEDIAKLEQAEKTATENVELKARLALLEQKDRSREVADRVARCTVKAFHADLEAVYAHALANPAAKVKHFAVKDGKRIESEKSIAEVVDSLVSSINTGAKQLFSVVTNQGETHRAEGPSEDAGAELDAKAKARIREGKSKDYAEAMDAVLADDVELAAKYHEQQSARRS